MWLNSGQWNVGGTTVRIIRNFWEGCSKGANLGERNIFCHSYRLKHRWDVRSSRSILGYWEWKQYCHRDACCTTLGSTIPMIFCIKYLHLKLKDSCSKDDGGNRKLMIPGSQHTSSGPFLCERAVKFYLKSYFQLLLQAVEPSTWLGLGGDAK